MYGAALVLFGNGNKANSSLRCGILIGIWNFGRLNLRSFTLERPLR